LSAWLHDAYPWIKSAHIVSMVAWMAGLLYLPRLFVYHAMAPIGSDRSETFKIMEGRLQRGIMNPAMIATWGFGLALAGTPGTIDWGTGWIWAKLTLVVGLSGFHAALGQWRHAFRMDRNMHSMRFFRIVNELPTLVLIAIVLLVVIKPF
jgi:protoporphyrinogen IX oxidase